MDQRYRYRVIIEPDEDGVFIATARALPGVVGHGDTADEAFENMREAMRFTLDSMIEEGETLPKSDVSVLGETRSLELAIS